MVAFSFSHFSQLGKGQSKISGLDIRYKKRHPSSGQVSRKISCKPFLIYRSNEPADQRKPCRDELRREPSRERCHELHPG